MVYNFDEMINRKNTDSVKYDFAIEHGKPDDVLPLWVADMDFMTPPCVIEALVNRSRHGIFGYSDTKNDYAEILRNWFSHHFEWHVNSGWLVKTPGVVYAISAAIRAMTDKGDAVLIQPPVYSPFSEVVIDNERQLVLNRLVYEEGKYSIDFEDFEDKIINNKVKMFILCSPHNPVGRVWTRSELMQMGDICLKHKVIVVSDEIHADFIYRGNRHFVFASLNPAFHDITITCTSPTKTFNLAGLQISNIFIANSDIRKKFNEEIKKSGYCPSNSMGIVACKAAYENGFDWLTALKAYLEDNLDFIRNFLNQRLPDIKLVEPEGTYLVWLDCKGLGLDDKQLDDFMVHKARLWLNAGSIFGVGGEGFQRVNIACTRTILKKAFTQLEVAINHQ